MVHGWLVMSPLKNSRVSLLPKVATRLPYAWLQPRGFALLSPMMIRSILNAILRSFVSVFDEMLVIWVSFYSSNMTSRSSR